MKFVAGYSFYFFKNNVILKQNLAKDKDEFLDVFQIHSKDYFLKILLSDLKFFSFL